MRTGTSEDFSFVFATWLRSYKHSSHFAKRIPDRTFYVRHHAVIERILARGAELLVACPADAPETILGYLVREGATLHFLYVKGPFRRMGVAKALVGEYRPEQFTHWTNDLDHVRKMVGEGVQYDPYLI